MRMDVYNILTCEYEYWIKLHYSTFLPSLQPPSYLAQGLVVIYPRGRKYG